MKPLSFVSTIPSKIWIIFDSPNGPLIFRSKKEAEQEMKEWGKQVED